MCAAQDDAFRHRAKLLGQARSADPRFLALLQQQEERGFGKSVNALFKTSRLLYKLSSEHVFHVGVLTRPPHDPGILTSSHVQTLKASRTVNTQTYRYYIASKHLAHFRHVVFDCYESSHLDNLVASLDRFARIDELTLQGYAAEVAFGTRPVFALDPAHPATSRFAELAPRIRTLHLVDVTPTAAAPYLRALPSLSHFHYIVKDLYGPFDPSPLIQALPPLQHFHCEIEQGGMVRHCFETLAATPQDWAPLKRLTLTVPYIRRSWLRHLNLFEASLERLELSVERDESGGVLGTREESDVPSWIDDGVHFPVLRSVSIIGSGMLCKDFFLPVTNLHLPSLEHLRVSFSADCRHGKDFTCSLGELLDDHELLDSLQFFAPDGVIDGDDKGYIEYLDEDYGLDIAYRDCPEASYPEDAFIDASYPSRHNLVIGYPRGGRQEEEAVALKKSLKRLFTYFLKTFYAAEAVRDLPTLYRLAVLLRPLECERLAQFD